MENVVPGEDLDALRSKRSNPTISTTTTTEGCAFCRDYASMARGFDYLQ